MLLAAVQKMLKVALFILPIVVHVFPPYKTKCPWVRRLQDNGACTGTGG